MAEQQTGTVGQTHDALKRAEEVLKVRVLDNLDELVKDAKDGPIDKAQLDSMVKRPIMEMVKHLERTRLALLNPRRNS